MYNVVADNRIVFSGRLVDVNNAGSVTLIFIRNNETIPGHNAGVRAETHQSTLADMFPHRIVI